MEFYLELIRTIFQAADEEGRLRNRIVAFTASTPGAGVSYVVNTLATAIAKAARSPDMRRERAAPRRHAR